MIVYKIEKQAHARANNRIREMDAVLKEIAPTLEILSQLMAEHAETISSPTINAFRSDLQHRIAAAIADTSKIAEDTQRMITVSDQAGKHLTAIEEHFSTHLRNRPPVNQAAPNQLVA